MEAKQWKEAAEIYSKATGKLPEGGFDRNLGFIAQEWLRETQATPETDAVDKAVAHLLKRFAENEDLQNVAANHFACVAVGFADKGMWENALATIERGESFFDGNDQLLNAARHTYDRRADAHSTKGEWEKAIEAYSDALKRLPEDPHLTNNASVTWNSWARTYIDAKDWERAIEVYEKAMKVFPDSGTFRNNLEYCKQQRDRGDNGS